MPKSGEDENDGLTRASRIAIGRAKHRGDEEVLPDDLLAGSLQVMSRFGIAVLGPLTIDLQGLGVQPLDELASVGPKVAYSESAAALFDRAAQIARHDGSQRTRPVHMLAAFANEEEGLMGRLKHKHGISAADWRAALAQTDVPVSGDGETSTAAVKELLSPDEAAEFLGVHTQTVRGYIRSGKLQAHRLAGERALRIRRQDLLDLLEPYDDE